MAFLLRLLLAVFAPPLGVFATIGIGRTFWLNIPLTLFGHVPGMVHAVWIVARYEPIGSETDLAARRPLKSARASGK